VASRERALAERVKRRRAERECQVLRDALYQHTHFLRGLQGFLLSPSPTTTLVRGVRSFSLYVCIDALSLRQALNLYHHLHSFTRLPREAPIRELEYAALQRDQRFLAAVELLQRETASLPVAAGAHTSHTDFCHAPDEPCAVTTKRVLVLDDCDVATAVHAACVAVHDVVVRCRAYAWVGVAGESLDADTLGPRNLQYSLTRIRRTRPSEAESQGFSVASRLLTMRKVAHDRAIVLWDFVDDDELHPLDETPDIVRQGVGACLIERDVGGRTVYRELSTRRYEYRGPTPPSPSVVRYFASKRQAMRSYERLFRDLMLEQIALEKSGNRRGPVMEVTV
jgi:hypothetical protein